ncbi:ribosomal protein L7/L12 [Streptomyces sp. NPDC059564]|uniref:ribosomal protein L7/L12 n=1 Tax=Streptomyces sp. NPDC059564 TaxID=3346865 RepID=UPI00369AD0D4
MEEPGFRAILQEVGSGKIEVVHAIRKITGLSLWGSKQLAERTPIAVTEVNWLEVARDAARDLQAAGAGATVVCDWCARTIPENCPVDPGPCAGPWPPGTCRASSPPK